MEKLSEQKIHRLYIKRIVLGLIAITLIFFNFYFKTYKTINSQDNKLVPTQIYIEKEYFGFYSSIIQNLKEGPLEITQLKADADLIISSHRENESEYELMPLLELTETIKPREFILILNSKNSFTLWLGVKKEHLAAKKIAEEIKSRTQVNTLLFTGDIMLSRSVGQKMRSSKNYTQVVEQVKDLFSQSDYRIANLESPFSQKEFAYRQGMVFQAEKEAIEVLKNNFNLVSLANNHFGDQGQDGVKFTVEHLAENNISFIGGGLNSNQAYQPHIKEFNAQKIGFLSYTDTDVIPENYHAKDDQGGVAVMNIERMKKDIEALKEKTPNIIVMMHSGTEYKAEPNSRQIEFAHAAVEAGAKLVVGTHPHVVQGVERYKGIPIIYSLGNFIFDQTWSKETTQGMVLKVTYGLDKVLGLEFLPIKIDSNFSPRLLAGDESEAITIFDRIYSASLGLR